MRRRFSSILTTGVLAFAIASYSESVRGGSTPVIECTISAAFARNGRPTDNGRNYLTPSTDVFKELMTNGFVHGATVRRAASDRLTSWPDCHK